jgi:hypothetical protein
MASDYGFEPKCAAIGQSAGEIKIMHCLKITAIAFLLSGTVTFAQVVAPVTKVERQGAQSMIRGTVLDVNSKPVPNVTVRLRNVKTKKVEQQGTANHAGEFSFVAPTQVSYVVEIVDHAGHVIAVGDVVMAQAGALTRVVVSIPAHLPSVAGVLGEAAGAVVSAVSSIGVTSESLAPASPEK